MAHFNTDEDYSDNYDSGYSDYNDYNDYGNETNYDPEGGFDIGGIKQHRHNPFSGLQGLSGKTIGYIIFIAIWIIILFNFESILNWLFYQTFGLLQYIILALIIVGALYLLFRRRY